MISALSEVMIVNQALRHLGEDPITALTDTSRRAQLASEHYPWVRDAVLEEHPWNFALRRQTLFAYTAPTSALTYEATAQVTGSTGVAFSTINPSTFVATDVGRTFVATTGPGRATITAFVNGSTVLATINEAWAGVGMAEGLWRLYYPTPPFEFTFSIPLPTDYLRMWRKTLGEEYKVEGTFILCDTEALEVLYIRQVTDTTLYPPMFVRALVCHLTAVFAENITGQREKSADWLKIYEMRLRLAKARDGQEGTPDRIMSGNLVRVRYGGRARNDRLGY